MKNKKETVNEKDTIEQILGSTTIFIGVISIISAFLQPLAGMVLGIIGLINSAKKKTTLHKRGKILNIIGIIISIIFAVAMMVIKVYMSSANMATAGGI